MKKERRKNCAVNSPPYCCSKKLADMYRKLAVFRLSQVSAQSLSHLFSLAPQQMMTIISLSSRSTSRRTCRNAAANYNNNLQEHSNVDRSCSSVDEAMRENAEMMMMKYWALET